MTLSTTPAAMPATATPTQKPIQSAFGKPTNHFLAFSRKLRTPRSRDRLNIALNIADFHQHKKWAVETARAGNPEGARFWAKRARDDWRVIAAWLGLPAPKACR